MPKKITLSIQGMTCAACVARIEKKLSRLDGVSKVSVNLPLGKGEVEFDDTKIDAERLISTINDLGYSAFPEKKTAVDDTRSKDLLTRFVISAILSVPLLSGMIVHLLKIGAFDFLMNPWFQLAIATPVQFYAGFPFYKGAYHNLKTGGANMDVLVALGTSAAYFYSFYNIFNNGYLYFETSSILITLVLLGKYLESKATKKAADAIKKLLSLAPTSAKVEKNGAITELPIKEIEKGDILLIGSGDRIPLDGVVVDGEGVVDESAITGESIPVSKTTGNNVIAGTINISKGFRMRVTSRAEETLLSQIIKIVEEAQTSKAPIQRFADRVSAYFVPSVIGISVVTFIAWYISIHSFNNALMAAIAVLVISCPCALGLATPTSIMVASGIGSKNGILFKNSEAIEQLNKIDTVIMDKTGTITTGKLSVEKFVNLSDLSDEVLLSLVYHIEKFSSHPVAKAVADYGKDKALNLIISGINEIAGSGIEAVWEDKRIFVGKIGLEDITDKNANVGVYIDKTLAGYFVVADTIKEHVKEHISMIKKLGIEIFMLTGDKRATAEIVGEKAGIDKSHIIAEVLPTEKAYYVEKIKKEGRFVAMVGDGINDAPALSVADIGIAMGTGTDIAIDVADIILINGSIELIYRAIILSRKTLVNIKQNLFWAFCYNVVGIPLAALGMLNPLIAGAAMSFSSVSVVTNALRLKKVYARAMSNHK